jgi:hypothetical protein
MKRKIWLPAVIVTLCLGSATARAVSTPVVQGVVSGLELCEQAVCGSAVFVGAFFGQVGFNPRAVGLIAVAVNHDPLPAPGFCADITGGRWEMWVGFRRLRGGVTGELCATFDNTFIVDTTLSVESGGSGQIAFNGLLDHNVFPPTIKGVMTQ